MKNLYTITFESDSTSEEEEAKSTGHLPVKPPRPANSNTKIRPFPKASKIKITTRNLSEESRKQSYSSLIQSGSNTSSDISSQKDNSSESYESNDKYSDRTYIEKQKIAKKKKLYDYDYDSEEKESTEQDKSYNSPNLSHHQKNMINSQADNLNDHHSAKNHMHSHQKNKNIDDSNGNFSDKDINTNQNQNETNDIQDSNNIDPNQINEHNNISNNSSDIGGNTILNDQIHNSETSNDNIKLSDIDQSNSTSSNLIASSSSFQQFDEPLHFTVTRQMKVQNIFNKKNIFTFTDSQNNCLFEAKPEKGSQSIININCGPQYNEMSSQIPQNFNSSINSSTNQFGVIICSPEMDSFSLRLNNQYGCEVMSARINSKKSKNSSSSALIDRIQKGSSGTELNPNFDLNGNLRILKVNFFFDGSKKIEKRLQNAESFGVALDFGQRTVVRSTKNFILLDNCKREFVAVRKIEKNHLCIDFQPTIPAFCAFAIGLIAFLYKS